MPELIAVGNCFLDNSCLPEGCSFSPASALYSFQESQEFLPINSEGTHVRSDDVLAQVLCHHDHNRPRHSRLGHDQVITLDSGHYATGKPANIAKLLP